MSSVFSATFTFNISKYRSFKGTSTRKSCSFVSELGVPVDFLLKNSATFGIQMGMSISQIYGAITAVHLKHMGYGQWKIRRFTVGSVWEFLISTTRIFQQQTQAGRSHPSMKNGMNINPLIISFHNTNYPIFII